MGKFIYVPLKSQSSQIIMAQFYFLNIFYGKFTEPHQIVEGKKGKKEW